VLNTKYPGEHFILVCLLRKLRQFKIFIVELTRYASLDSANRRPHSLMIGTEVKISQNGLDRQATQRAPDSGKICLDTLSGRLCFHLDNVLLVIFVPQAGQNAHLLRLVREYTFCSCDSHSEGWDKRWARFSSMPTSGILYPAVSYYYFYVGS
jgi:hypothetical protein